MHTIDLQLRQGLTRMQRAYDALLERTTPIDQMNAEKVILDAQWQGELSGVLNNLYWHPFRNGINEAPDEAGELRRWLKEQFRDAAAVAMLLLLLRRYQVRAVNLGGRTGLAILGIDGVFSLVNDEYLALLDAHATHLTSQGTEFSLVDTTIDDLATALPAAREGAGSTLLALAGFVAARVALRTVVIERTERPRQVANGLNWTFLRNGVRLQMYDVNGIGCPKICAPLHGRTMPVDNIPFELRLPQHPNCDCIYTPILDDWTMPAEIWRGD
jgi:hypothetical protein